MSAAAVRLSDGEREVLTLAAQGLSRKRVARALGLSPHTVRTYTVRTYRKLGAATLPEAMLRAHALGLIDLDKIARDAEVSRA